MQSFVSAIVLLHSPELAVERRECVRDWTVVAFLCRSFRTLCQLVSTSLRMNPNQVRFTMACSFVVTIPTLRRACEDCLNRIIGDALVDRVYHSDELLDCVSVVHAIPLQNSQTLVRFSNSIQHRSEGCADGVTYLSTNVYNSRTTRQVARARNQSAPMFYEAVEGTTEGKPSWRLKTRMTLVCHARLRILNRDSSSPQLNSDSTSPIAAISIAAVAERVRSRLRRAPAAGSNTLS